MKTNDRMKEGWALTWDDERGFGVIGIDEGTYVAHASQIAADALCRRFLIPGERLSFLPIPRDSAGKTNRAYKVKPLERPPIEVPFDYHELVVVRQWTGEKGFAVRPLGGWLRFFADGIITEGIETIKVGTQLWVVPGPMRGSRANKDWIATQVQVCYDTPEVAQEPTDPADLAPDTVMASAFERITAAQ